MTLILLVLIAAGLWEVLSGLALLGWSLFDLVRQIIEEVSERRRGSP